MNVPNPKQLSQKLNKKDGFIAYRKFADDEPVVDLQRALVDAFGDRIEPLPLTQINRFRIISRDVGARLIRAAREEARRDAAREYVAASLRRTGYVHRPKTLPVDEVLDGLRGSAGKYEGKAIGYNFNVGSGRMLTGERGARVVFGNLITVPVMLSNKEVLNDAEQVADQLFEHAITRPTVPFDPAQALPLAAATADRGLIKEIEASHYTRGLVIPLEPLAFEH